MKRRVGRQLTRTAPDSQTTMIKVLPERIRSGGDNAIAQCAVVILFTLFLFLYHHFRSGQVH